MSKKKDIDRQRMLSAARKALAVRHAVTPVPRFNARAAGIDTVRKRTRLENQPTVEQEAKADYVETDVNERIGNFRRVKIGRAFKRRARFETIEGLTSAQLVALRRYRRAFDTSELSTVKSGLDVGPGGGIPGSDAALSRLEAVAFADVEVRRIEAVVSPGALFTLRMVALQDYDFAAVAQERYGTSSSRRRQRIRDEFLLGVAQLAATTAPPISAAPAMTIPAGPKPLPQVDPAYLDEHGFMRPMDEIAEIIRASTRDSASGQE